MSSLPPPAAPFLPAPSKADLLEKRLLGVDGGLDRSADGLQSSVVGFRPAGELEQGGLTGFEHFAKAGQVLPQPPTAAGASKAPAAAAVAAPVGMAAAIAATAVAPAVAANKPVARVGSLSPPPHAQHQSLVDSQGSTRVMDPNAQPVALVVMDAPAAPPSTAHTPLKRNADILLAQMAAAATGAPAALTSPAPPPPPMSPFDMPLSLAAPIPLSTAASPLKTLRPSAAALKAAAAGGTTPTTTTGKRKAASPSTARPRKPRGAAAAAADGSTTPATKGTGRSKKAAGANTPESLATAAAAASAAANAAAIVAANANAAAASANAMAAAAASYTTTDDDSPENPKRQKLPPQSLTSALHTSASPSAVARPVPTMATIVVKTEPFLRATAVPAAAAAAGPAAATPYALLTHPTSPQLNAHHAQQPGMTPVALSPHSLGAPAVPASSAAAATHAQHGLHERQMSDALGSKGKNIKSYFGSGGSSNTAAAARASAHTHHASASSARQLDIAAELDGSHAHFIASQSQHTIPHSVFGYSSQSLQQPSQPGAAPASSSAAAAAAAAAVPPGMDTDSDNEVVILGEGPSASVSGSSANGGNSSSMDTSSGGNAPTPTPGSSSTKKEKASSAGSAGAAATTAAVVAAVAAKKPARPRKSKKDSVSTSPLGSTAAASSPSAAAAAAAAAAGGGLSAAIGTEQLAQLHAQQIRFREWEASLAQRERALEEREAALERSKVDLNSTAEHVAALEQNLARTQEEAKTYQTRVHAVLHELFKELCESRFQRAEEKLIRDAVSIGRTVPQRAEAGLHLNAQVQDVWEDGEMIKEIRSKIAVLNKEKEDVETAKKKLARKKANLTRASKVKDAASAAAESKENGAAAAGYPGMSAFSPTGAAAAASTSMGAPAPRAPRLSLGGATAASASSAASSSAAAAASAGSDMDTGDDDDKDFKRPAPLDSFALREEEEICNLRLVLLKKALEEQELKAEQYDLQRKTLIRVAKLHTDCRSSRFNFHPILADRYIVLEMLGKGGFSEVYKAFDLVELRFVACKIHQLNPQWSESRKMNYTRHATREYNIHKTLQHHRVVQLYDVFAIDREAFCTVLEHCDGSDLDMYLKLRHTLPEREARCIILQVFSGLKYLNEQKQKIIHYDLKPGNILFHQGEVKITDFGLSKVTPEGNQDGIELTSQGSGTYWYLPPECFSNDPLISSAVDVWSAGIVLYQMLYGKKPFGHGLSPDAIISQRTMQDARKVPFPDSPVVSKASKDFIEKCLSFDPKRRPDILEILKDPYFGPKSIPMSK